MSVELPIIDFSSLSLNISDGDITLSTYDTVGESIVDAFTTIGFAYIVHHGIQAATVENATKISGELFELPVQTKKKYQRMGNSNHGWVQPEQESLNPERPGDLKEAYNCTCSQAKVWPDDDVPGFSDVSLDVITQCETLTFRVLRAMAIGLKLEPSVFIDGHKNQRTGSMTTFRYLLYPPLPESIKPGQIRCGEHSDYGSITLLFQDAIGGLQVYTRSGEWLDATPLDGAVLVNIGDLMQRWTSDKLVSTKHRVIIPEAELKKKQIRRSMAYFGHPDDDAIITCIDGSNKYEPINSLDYLNMRFAVTY